eukprot:4655175-Amphidinium_carterae.1
MSVKDSPHRNKQLLLRAKPNTVAVTSRMFASNCFVQQVTLRKSWMRFTKRSILNKRASRAIRKSIGSTGKFVAAWQNTKQPQDVQTRSALSSLQDDTTTSAMVNNTVTHTSSIRRERMTFDATISVFPACQLALDLIKSCPCSRHIMRNQCLPPCDSRCQSSGQTSQLTPNSL